MVKCRSPEATFIPVHFMTSKVVDSRDPRSPARRDKQMEAHVYLHLLLPPRASLVAVQSLLTSRLQIQTALVFFPPTHTIIYFNHDINDSQ